MMNIGLDESDLTDVNINIFLLFVGGKQVRKLIIPVDV